MLCQADLEPASPLQSSLIGSHDGELEAKLENAGPGDLEADSCLWKVCLSEGTILEA